MFKKGQSVVVFDRGEPSLLVEVQSFKGDYMGGWVVNGNWDFTMNVRSGDATIHAPTGDRCVSGWSVYPLSLFPSAKGGYNSVLESVRASGFRPGQSTFLRLWWLRTSSRVSEFLRRVPKALSAFMAVMGGAVLQPEKAVSEDEEWDDEIPF